MMFQQPPFRHLPPYVKMLSLLLVVISTALLIMAVGTGIGMLIFGRDILDVLSQNANYNESRTVMALKYFQIVNQFGVFILPAFVFVLLTDNDITGYLGLRENRHNLSIVNGVVLIMVSLPLIHWLMELNSAIRLPEYLSGMENWMKAKEEEAQVLTEVFLSAKSIGGFLFNLIMIAAVAAIGEELIFRGILVRLFREWTRNVHLAVFIPALVFSALHLQFYGFIPRLLLGMFLGYLFVWTGSLRVPIIVHFANNAFAVILSFIDARGLVHVDAEKVGYSSSPWVIGASMLLTISVLVVIYYHERRLRMSKVEE